MNVAATMTVETRIMDCKTGRCLKRQRKRNLILDYGLNTFAGGNGLFRACPVYAMTDLQVGSGTQPTAIASGAVTLTSSGTALTASGSFFTSRMIGALIKMGASGSGGQEFYIASVSSGTSATAATAPSPDVAAEAFTVYFVQETALETPGLSTSTYQTSAGDNGTTVSGGIVTHKRTFLISTQATPYTVNEIGYKGGTGTLSGRVVLPSSDVVAPTNFYVVVLNLALTFLPDTPAAFTDIGVNINVGGTIAIEKLSIVSIDSAGQPNINSAWMDFNNPSTSFALATFSQAGSIPNTIGDPGILFGTALAASSGGTATASNPSRGVHRRSYTNWTQTTAGESLHGIGFGSDSQRICASIKFTAPVTAPTGTFQLATIVWDIVYNRTLVN